MAVEPKVLFYSRTSVRPVYRRCNLGGLREIAKRRGIQLQSHLKIPGLIKLLRDRDGQETFDFMGLPAEIRNMVYQMVLVYPQPGSVNLEDLPLLRPMRSGGGKAILRTCRQIYQEAAGVIIAEIPVTCAFQLRKKSGDSDDQYGSFVGRLRHDSQSFDALHSRLDRSQREVRRAEKIHLIIKVDDALGQKTGRPSGNKWHAPIVSMLRNFAAVMMDDHNVQTINLIIDLENSMLSGRQKREVLLPLMRLYGILRVIVKAKGVSAALRTSLSQSIRAGGRKQNLLMHSFRLDQEVQALTKVLGPAQKFLRAKAQRLLGKLLLAVPVPGCWSQANKVDVEDERAFHAARCKLEDILNRVGVEEAQARLNRIRQVASFEDLPNDVLKHHFTDWEAYIEFKKLRLAFRNTQGLLEETSQSPLPLLSSQAWWTV